MLGPGEQGRLKRRKAGESNYKIECVKEESAILLTNLRVAISDATVKRAGPALGFGSFARTSQPLSIVKINALLCSPSAHFVILVPSVNISILLCMLQYPRTATYRIELPRKH